MWYKIKIKAIILKVNDLNARENLPLYVENVSRDLWGGTGHVTPNGSPFAGTWIYF